jgi:hypothetical protein
LTRYDNARGQKTMTEEMQAQGTGTEAEEAKQADTTNVTPLFGRQPRPASREPAPTDEEIAEYRRIRPQLLQMLDEWNRIKGYKGCPAARAVLGLNE